MIRAVANWFLWQGLLRAKNTDVANMAEMSSDFPSSKLFALLRESRWLLLVAGALYLALVLYGYDRADPSWSHSVTGAQTTNPGGVMGAYLADVLFYVLGFSAWWLVLYMLQRVWAGYHLLSADSIFCKRSWWVSVSGFTVLLLSSSAFEAIRLYTLKVTLPDAHGGILGVTLGQALTGWFGFTGATLLLLTLIATGFSLFSGLSWLRFVDWLGAALDTTWQWTRMAWQTWQDRRIGAQAINKRGVVVEEEKRRVEEHQPIHIEMPVIEVVRSARANEEKQAPLFADMPDSPLPPLHLLDQASQHVEVISADTLEFTSRLIERKLNDFGVEVKVVEIGRAHV